MLWLFIIYHLELESCAFYRQIHIHTQRESNTALFLPKTNQSSVCSPSKVWSSERSQSVEHDVRGEKRADVTFCPALPFLYCKGEKWGEWQLWWFYLKKKNVGKLSRLHRVRKGKDIGCLGSRGENRKMEIRCHLKGIFPGEVTSLWPLENMMPESGSTTLFRLGKKHRQTLLTFIGSVLVIPLGPCHANSPILNVDLITSIPIDMHFIHEYIFVVFIKQWIKILLSDDDSSPMFQTWSLCSGNLCVFLDFFFFFVHNGVYVGS